MRRGGPAPAVEPAGARSDPRRRPLRAGHGRRDRHAKFLYDVWGDTVNIASRIESGGQPNRVLISAVTAKGLEKDFKLDGPHQIETKE